MPQTRTIVKLLLWIITLPFYIYALLKWHQFKGHFLFQKRFPKVSYTLFCIAFFGQTLSLSEDFLFDHNVSSEMVDHHIGYCVLSLTFAIYGLVFYRINLVYLKWKSLHEITKPSSSPLDLEIKKATSKSVTLTIINNIAGVTSADVVADPIETKTKANVSSPIIRTASTSINERQNNVYRSKLSVIILIFIFFATLIPLLSHSIAENKHFVVFSTEVAVLLILIALSILNIKHKKVKEGIGCIMECYAILISLLVQMVLQIASTTDRKILGFTTFFILHFCGLVTLYIPLILLFKSEGTLDIYQHNHKTDDKIFQDASTCMDLTQQQSNININGHVDDNIVTDLPTDLPIIKAIHSQHNHPQNNTNNNNINNNTKPMENSSIFVNKCLFHFLYRNQPNHAIFSEYLRFCFASENILFVERVSIFYQIVLKLQEHYQMSLIKVGNINSNHVSEISEAISTLTLPSSVKATATATHSLTLSISTSGLSFRNSEISMTHSQHSRISAVYIDENGDVTHPPSDLGEQTTPQPTPQQTPTMTVVTPIPKTFNWKDVKQSKETRFPDLKYIYRFEFEYLKDVYDHYQQIIDLNSKPNDDYDINIYKKSLYLISKEIYDQFISSDARTQVNLGYEVSKPLKYLLGNGDTLDKFHNYDDFLRLFDGAVIETYRLIINVYNFRFVKYVKNRFTDAVFEKR